jgi:hypothetical protein
MEFNCKTCGEELRTGDSAIVDNGKCGLESSGVGALPGEGSHVGAEWELGSGAVGTCGAVVLRPYGAVRERLVI